MLFLASIVGGLGTLFLFLKIPLFKFLILEFSLSILIIVIAFGKSNIWSNLLYFYLNALLLGGLILLFNNWFSLSYKGNFLILMIITPVMTLVYKNQIKVLKTNYNLNYKVEIKVKDQIIKLNSFFDTGNNLVDPYFNYPVILINESLIKSDKYFYIPYSTITESGVIKAVLADSFKVFGLKTINKVVIGLLPINLKLRGIECLLNYKILEATDV